MSRRPSLKGACSDNSRCVATTSEREAVRIPGRIVDTGHALVSDLYVQEDESNREFDRMMRDNRGVL